MRSTLTHLAAITAAALTTAAHATNINPGQTVDPLTSRLLPANTLERTIEHDYDITIPAFPINRHVRGTITQRVYRLADDSLVFSYTVSNNDTSTGGVTDVTVRDFEGYTTDVNFAGGIGTSYWPDRAVRAADGSSLRFEYDLGIPTPATSRPFYVDTNATSFAPQTGRFILISGRVTVCSGGNCDTVYGFAFPIEDSTPPVVSITSPASLTCVCNPATITGAAYDTNGFDSYEIEYAQNPGGPWTLINASSTPVNPAGPLAVWNTTALAQGYYYLRLTALNAGGLGNAVTQIVFVDKQFDTVDVRAPQTGQILGGAVCFDGSVNDGNGGCNFNNYTIAYAPLPAGGPFAAVDPASPTYTAQVVNDGLGSWNSASVPDGLYRLRVRATDGCGNQKTVTRDVTIDNTRPIALISSPLSCSTLGSGNVQIRGTVSDAHMAGWVLQYVGGPHHTWQTIAQGNTTIVDGVLGTWNTAGLPNCAYAIRLVAGDAAGVNCSGNNNQTEYTIVARSAGCGADFDASGGVNVADIFAFLSAWFNGCP